MVVRHAFCPWLERAVQRSQGAPTHAHVHSGAAESDREVVQSDTGSPGAATCVANFFLEGLSRFRTARSKVLNVLYLSDVFWHWPKTRFRNPFSILNMSHDV